MTNFPQLQTKSAYSLFQSTLTLDNYFKVAKSYGYERLALTDFNQLSGALRFFQLADKYQIKGLLGLTLTVTDNPFNFDCLLYVKNQTGYQNLMILSSKKQTAETVSLTEVLLHLEGLLLVFPAKNPLKTAWEKQDKVAFQTFFEKLQPYILKNQIFMGVSFSERSDELTLMQWKSWLTYLEEVAFPSLFLHEVTYEKKDDAFSAEILKAIGNQEVLDLPKVTKVGESYLWTQQEFDFLLKEPFFASLVKRTQAFGKDIDFKPQLNQKLLPHYPLENQSASEFLENLVKKKAVERIVNYTPEYEKRLKYELKVIQEMGFSDYFLIVWDVMNYCHEHHILTGAGRGSAAGSLVAFVLHITDVDPIKYQLLFERFLNPERKSMPDIDMDIPDLKREEVLRYVNEKYGKEQVAQIATFGTLAAKQVLKDVGRVFGYSQSEMNQLTKSVPNVPKITLAKSLEESKKFASLIKSTDKNQLLFNTALKLEGLPRHVSTHAAGVVIGDGPLIQWLPLQTGSNDIYLTQFTMGDVEKIGLLKMDFLGLKNLTILQEALENVQKVFNPHFSLEQIPLNDELTLQLFQKGDTTGIFQFESLGIRSVLKRLKPTSFEDVVAVNALYRPGPMENIDHFIKRKHGKEPITFLDDSLKKVLGNTYGIMVYQEQVMQVAHEFAGFSLGEADLLRRGIAKKKKEELEKQRQYFIAGAQKNGHDKKTADEIYRYIEKFANYGFNRSHAFAYSVVAYQLAYLKAHYPIAFYTALLNSIYNNDDKIKSYFGELKKRSIQIFPPQINYSNRRFTPQKEGITYGLGKIKGMRRDFIQEILTLRKERRFSSLNDFLVRIDKKWLKEEIIAPLIMVGAFDFDEKNRRLLLQKLPGRIQNVLFSAGSLDLLEVMTLKSEEVADFTLNERLEKEEMYLGTFVSGHPIDTTKKYQKYFPSLFIAEYEDKKTFQSFIYVKDIRQIRTKKGEQMAFISGQDLSGETSFTLFPVLYRKYFPFVKKESILYLSGKVEYSSYQNQLQGIVEKIQPLEEIQEIYEKISRWMLYLKVKQDYSLLEDVKKTLSYYKGFIPVMMYYEDTKKVIKLPETYGVDGSEALLKRLQSLLGENGAVLKEKKNSL